MSSTVYDDGEYAIVREYGKEKCAVWHSLHCRWFEAGLTKMIWPIARFANKEEACDLIMSLQNAKCPQDLTFIESLAWAIDHFDGYLDENQLKLVSRLNISKKDRRRVAELLGLDPDELTMTDEDKIAAKN